MAKKTSTKTTGKRVTKTKTWRKTKINDVEEALEDDRLIDRLRSKSAKGKGQIKPDLFTIDTTGSGEGLSLKTKREIARAKIFPPKGPKLGLSATEEMKVEKAEKKMEAKSTPVSKSDGQFDLWAVAKAEEDQRKKQEAAFPQVRRMVKRLPHSKPKCIEKAKGSAPAVLPAHEGQSINPKLDSYEEILCKAAALQLEREEEQQTLNRVKHPLTHELQKANGAEAVKEMDDEAKISAFRELSCPIALAAGEAAGEDEPFARRQKKMRIKAQSKRNRDPKTKMADEKLRQINTQKKLEKSVGDIAAILKDMKEEEEQHAQRREYKNQQRLKRKELEAKEGVVPKMRKLGFHKFKEQNIVVPDVEAATGGLRSMPLKGPTALKERAASIMRRGLLPAIPESSVDLKQRNKFHVKRKLSRHTSAKIRKNIQRRS